LTRETAIQLLSTGSTHERLKAARLLARDAVPGDMGALRRARRVETVSYVKTSLDAAIARLSNLPETIASDQSEQFDVPEAIRKRIHSQAIEWIAGLLLQEIASPIGLAKRTAAREIPDYENSRTKRHLESVEQIFEAIEQLKGAAGVPKPEQFDGGTYR
jgi:hypothetical protein